jgi:hypothetical protein
MNNNYVSFIFVAKIKGILSSSPSAQHPFPSVCPRNIAPASCTGSAVEGALGAAKATLQRHKAMDAGEHGLKTIDF